MKLYDSLQSSPLFQGLTSDNLLQIIGQTKFTFRKIDAGDIIKKDGEQCNRLALVVNAAAVEAPSLSVKVIKTESIFGEPLYNKVTVAVYLESGSLNTFEFNFKTKDAVCQSISEGSHSGSVLFSSQVNPQC